MRYITVEAYFCREIPHCLSVCLISLFFKILQLSCGIRFILRHYDSAQPSAASRRIQDGSSSCWRASEDGCFVTEEQCEVLGNYNRLSSDSGLRQSRKQGIIYNGHSQLTVPNFDITYEVNPKQYVLICQTCL